MQANDVSRILDYIRVDLVGSEYSYYQEQAIRNELNSYDCRTVIRGEHSVACGVGLAFSIAMTIVEGVAVEFISTALKGLAVKIKEAISGEDSQAACFANAVIEVADCDLIIKANCNAGIDSDCVNYDALIRAMLELSKTEKGSGRVVKSIEAPCDIDLAEDIPEVRCCGIGNYSLWRVAYRDGERWPYWLYDAVNDCFSPLGEDLRLQTEDGYEDVFYSRIPV